MNTRNCYKVNIDTTGALKADVLTSRIGKYLIENYTSDFDEIFNINWFNTLSKNVGKIQNVLIFSRPALWSTDVAHIDLSKMKTPVTFAFNWIISGKNSEMLWHEPPRSIPKDMEIKTTMANTMSYQWPANSLKVIDKQSITEQMFMVRTDIPHSIQVNQEPRIAISIRPFISFYLNWEQSVDFFKKRNLLIK